MLIQLTGRQWDTGILHPFPPPSDLSGLASCDPSESQIRHDTTAVPKKVAPVWPAPDRASVWFTESSWCSGLRPPLWPPLPPAKRAGVVDRAAEVWMIQAVEEIASRLKSINSTTSPQLFLSSARSSPEARGSSLTRPPSNQKRMPHS